MKDSISNTETEADRSAGGEPWLPTWDASYAANTGHHRRYDAAFLALTPIRPTDRLLDLGCGSGDFTRLMANQVPDGHVVGLDPQPALLAEARAVAGANQSFVPGPVQHLGDLFADDAAFDGMSAGQPCSGCPWPTTPASWPRSTACSGLEAGSAWRWAVPGTSFGWRHGWRPSPGPTADPDAPWSFPDAGTYLELLEQAGFAIDADPAAVPGRPVDQPGSDFVRTTAQRRPFDRDSLLGWLRSQCYQGFELTMPPGEPRRLPGRGGGPPRRAGPPRRHLRPDLRPPRRPGQAMNRPRLKRPIMA